MSFKPMKSGNGGNFDGETRNYPTPRDGSRKARVSLIIDLGIQARDPIYKLGDKIVTEDTEGAVETAQKSCQQVAIFADLTADKVDYGGDIGTAPYRLLLNKAFKGVLQGINLTTVPPTDAKGKRIEGRDWTFHPNSTLTKLAKATEREDVLKTLDIDLLLGEAFMADVEVKKTEDKNGKTDKEGNVIVYTNVNFKGASKVPNQENDAGDDIGKMPVPPLKDKPMSIQFDTATKEQVQFIRSNIRKQIKLAENYAGTAMQRAIEAFEAERAQESTSDNDTSGDDTPAKAAEKPAEKAKATTKAADKKAKASVVEDDDDSAPF